MVDFNERAGVKTMEQEKVLPREKGHIKWFSDKKGYGFLVAESDQVEIFVHASKLPKDWIPQQGDPIEFCREQTAKGFRALDVVRV